MFLYFYADRLRYTVYNQVLSFTDSPLSINIVFDWHSRYDVIDSVRRNHSDITLSIQTQLYKHSWREGFEFRGTIFAEFWLQP